MEERFRNQRSMNLSYNFLPKVVLSFALGLAACSKPATIDDVRDPLEATNRQVHEFNKLLDRAFLRPAGEVYADWVPEPIQIGFGNFSSYLSIPASIVNNLLQFNLAAAAENSVRLVVNTTVGVLGVYDASAEVGLYGQPSDFGQTLHTWGFGEGPYLELPVMGPSTGRDTVGVFVDAMFNPMTAALPDEWKISGPMVKTAAMIGDRGRFSDTLDSILYDSADSYAQARLFYLQSRRHELGMVEAEEEVFDPYEDLYGDGF